MIITVKTKAFKDQNPGTSGLRKKLVRFQTPHYTENFIQSIFDCIHFDKGNDLSNKLLIVGGDGRLFNREVSQKILKIAAANGFARVMLGRGGLLSTPAVSHLVCKYQACGGIILSASHNPGGQQGDFGIKYDIGNGGPAPEHVTSAIFARSQQIDQYRIFACDDINLDRTGRQFVGSMRVDVIDPVADYADLMQDLFDFDLIRDAVARGLSFHFDAMHAVTGPYAQEIFVNRLGVAANHLVNAIPMPDFGGLHPDPNPVQARALYDLMMSRHAPDLGAASDGDGDRNMIMGRNIFVSPSDSLAILAANARYIQAYSGGLIGVARSMPTSTAVDRVAQAQGFALFETPTGWKFFANLLEQGKITLCGEESFGTGGAHLREKDGIWAVLCWLTLLSATGQSVKEIVHRHWCEFGRTYHSRHDYEAVESERARQVMDRLSQRLDRLVGTSINGMKIEMADNFTYHDPVDQTVSTEQGLRILFKGGARLVYRLSGTGTQGATLRLYMERHEADSLHHHLDTQTALRNLVNAADKLADLHAGLARKGPSLIT